MTTTPTSAPLARPDRTPGRRADPVRVSLLAVVSWALYDFANTIFSLNIVTNYFPQFITDDAGLDDWQYAVPFSISMLLVGLVSPLMGSLSDRGEGRRMPWLITMTLICVALTAAMGLTGNVLLIIGALIGANAAFQLSLIFYDALLPSVSTPENWGKVSGLGVGLGYVGALAGGYSVQLFIGGDAPAQHAFLPTAFLFLLFALPCFIFVRERATRVRRADLVARLAAAESTLEPPIPGPTTSEASVPGATLVAGEQEKLTFRSSLTQTWRTIQEIRSHPDLARFLVANFLYSDALNTVIIAMGVYATQAMGFASAFDVLAPAIATSVLGSWLFGFLTDWLTSKQALTISLLLWVLVFVAAIVVSDPFIFQWVIATAAGVALGSTWVSARTLMIELSPPAKLGEFMGIYNLTGKFAAVIGPLVWGGVLALLDPDVFGRAGYQVGIASLLLMVLAGLALHYYGVPDIKRNKLWVEQSGR